MTTLPQLGALNQALLDAARALPEGGGYRFEPAPRGHADPDNPRDPSHDGVSRSLVYLGQTFATAAPDGATFCCGVTLEAFFDAWQSWAAAHGVPSEIPGVDADGIPGLLADWFCPEIGHSGAVDALVARGLGVAVAAEEARAGDLCQFWRRTDLANPSGHSVLFLAWGERAGARTIRYWSSQPATRGIGEHEEVIGPGWEIHLVRVGSVPGEAVLR